MKYRKKPVIVDAIIWNGLNKKEVTDFLGDHFMYFNGLNQVVINTLEGPIYASMDDYIIRGIHGEHYPCKPDIFNLTYEEVKDE